MTIFEREQKFFFEGRALFRRGINKTFTVYIKNVNFYFNDTLYYLYIFSIFLFEYLYYAIKSVKYYHNPQSRGLVEISKNLNPHLRGQPFLPHFSL